MILIENFRGIEKRVILRGAFEFRYFSFRKVNTHAFG